MKHKYTLGIVGGTFDHFHKGHEALLHAAFEQSEKVMIGLATEKLYKNKSFVESIEDYATREKSLQSFLNKAQYADAATILPIDDFYGNTLEEAALEALFVTEETAPNVEIINKERKKLGMQPAACVVIPFVYGNDGGKITSERIRAGEIDRKGNAYKLLFSHQQQFILPEKYREEFRKPIGNVVSSIDEAIQLIGDKCCIAVGDVVSLSLYKKNHQGLVSIVDLKTRREPMTEESLQLLHSFTPSTHVQNSAGMVEKEAVNVVLESLQHGLQDNIPQTIVVQGEEDLLVIPAVLFAPLETMILYGQFDQGVVVVRVTEQKKEEMVELVQKLH